MLFKFKWQINKQSQELAFRPRFSSISPEFDSYGIEPHIMNTQKYAHEIQTMKKWSVKKTDVLCGTKADYISYWKYN